MNLLEALVGSINKDHAVSLIPKLLPQIGPLMEFAKTNLKLTDDDIAGLFRASGSVQNAGQAVSAVAKQEPPKPAQNLPTPGMLRDHEGKDYTIEQISQILVQAKQLAEQQAQTQAQTAQPPAQAPAAPAKFPRSCLGCRDALGGTDQAGFGQSCMAKNCKGDPSRPNYSPLA